MIDEKNKVDESGIRKAPVPLYSSSVKQLPHVRQDFVLCPSLQSAGESAENLAEPSTAKDFQPKIKDVSKRWKHNRRLRNFFAGLLMLLATAVALLPFILSSVNELGANDTFKFMFVPSTRNTFMNIYNAFAGGATGAKVSAAIPDLIIAVGILALVCNLVKSIASMCGAIKVRRFSLCSLIYIIFLLIVLAFHLIGWEAAGFKKWDFMTDVINGWQSNEIVGLLITGGVGLVFSLIVKLISHEKYGYLR
ncbi:MAG: hypothetical protein J6S32_01505 [Clostridia bacterium]|nr:hypothetical protein [Clostridia bacterium]